MPAIMVLADQTAREVGATVRIEGDQPARFDPLLEELVYRTMREALANVRKHAAGTATIAIGLREHHGRLTATVRDNGPGFEPETIAARPDAPLHVGLATMDERLRAAGGELSISASPGHGTTVTLTVPAVRQLRNAA
jgi:two-component system sensor histidine kinase DegS